MALPCLIGIMIEDKINGFGENIPSQQIQIAKFERD